MNNWTTNVRAIILLAQFLESGGDTYFGFSLICQSMVNAYILEKLAGNKVEKSFINEG